jgi:uncharacterized protein (TIGR00369 family)
MTHDLETLRGFFASSPFMVELGIVPTAVEPGRVDTAMTLQRRHLQHTGQCHAGVMASIADHSMGAAAQTLVAEGGLILTAELKVSLLRAGRGDRLECEARVIKPGRMLSFTEAEVYAVEGEARTLVMKASATMAVTRPLP